MKRKVRVLVCDFCAAEGEAVVTREVSVDDGVVEVEACRRCWEKLTRGMRRKGRIKRRRRLRAVAAVALVVLALAGCSSKDSPKGESPPDVDWTTVAENQHVSIEQAVKDKDCDAMQTYFNGSTQADVLAYLDWQMKHDDCY